MFGSKFKSLKESFDKLKGQVETITRILISVKDNHLEFEESLEIIMKMLADGENNSNVDILRLRRNLSSLRKLFARITLTKKDYWT